MSENNKRFIIESSDIRKQLIKEHVLKYGSNTTEWFNTKSETIINQYVAELQKRYLNTPDNLSDLSSASEVFKKLNSIDWDFPENDTSYLTHDIHPYPAKYIPQIPCNMISALSLPGDIIWDPFGGSGTTALEALLLNRRSISTDANPLASIIGQCKTITLTDEEQIELQLCRQWLFDIVEIDNDYLDMKIQIPDIPNIEKWFHHNAIQELALIKGLIENLSPSCKVIAQVALSRTVSKVSNQESETRYASKPKELIKKETLRYFIGDLDTVFSKVHACSSLLQGKKAKFRTYDLREQLNQNSPILENQIDLIVTSPPYANVTDYHLYHRFRMFWLGFDPVKFGKVEIGSHLRHQREKTGFEDYMSEITPCLENCFKALKPGRFAVFVVGDSVFNKILYNTAEAYIKEATRLGFEYIGLISRNLPTSRRSFQSHARRATNESIVILRKPVKDIEIQLHEAPYKLWAFEKELLQREIQKLSPRNLTQSGEKVWSATVNCLNLDKAKKLTFIHKVTSSEIQPLATWQSIVENGDTLENQSLRKESKYATHGIHEYKGKFYPQLCKSLLSLSNLKEGSTVLDPFMGSGTTILESYLSGYRAYGCDINPLALKISKAKTEVLRMNPTILLNTLKTFLRTIEHEDPSTNSNYLYGHLDPQAHAELESWFPQSVINKIGILFEKIHKIPDNRITNFLEVIVSNLIRDISQQEPSDLRIRRRKEPLLDAPVIDMFKQNLKKQISKLESYFNSVDYSPSLFSKSNIWAGDCRKIDSFTSHGLTEGTIDAVITSPPYATALPYIDTNRLSLLILMSLSSKQRDPIEEDLIGSREIRNKIKGELEYRIERGIFDNITSTYAVDIITEIYKLNKESDVGFRRKNMASLLYSYFSSMTYFLDNMHFLLKEKGSAFIVIGNNTTKAGGKDLIIDTAKMLIESSEQLGFSIEDKFSITVTGDNKKNSSKLIKENTVLWLRK
ncbi:site-specific DNA-methyltransferase [Paenibacillus sp. 19GGS1-52]|uniref:DNA methyltransferase n=1 Tax=Paenibacillus sp. 19GGS1-52 TaxID=2758563 RepID=UPI001EFAAAB2|nr:DNA methyltransferase [Paenibacillus sp. 19GGS1-52]ULO07120.1 site-specific DNA-methyltransferase [Paenibacillus sp. 19GGS1-52]